MPLPSGMNKEVFDDIGYGSPLPRSQPVALDDSAGWLFQMGMITVVIGGHS